MRKGRGTEDRRSASRMPLQGCGVRVRRYSRWLLGRPVGPPFTGTVLNISRGGLCFRTAHHCQLGEQVVLTLYRKGKMNRRDTLTLRGRVVWCSAPGNGTRELVGVEFIGREATNLRRITSWLARHKQLLQPSRLPAP